MTRTRVDYATDQITVYRYCPYACRYCYVWNIPLFRNRVMRGKYDPVEHAKQYLRERNRVIVVSFVSDPYPPEEAHKKMTRKVLEVLAKTNNRVMILTKNPILALRDIDIMRKGDIWLGTTIVTLNEDHAQYWEPRAPAPQLRLQALQSAKTLGVKTWISIEPIIPYTTIPEEIVMMTSFYVDYYVLGAFNYPKHLKYNTYSEEVLRKWYKEHIPYTINFLENHGKQYHIKTELRRYLERP